MSDSSFKALVLRQDEDGKTLSAIEQLTTADLPDEEVLVKVEHSSLNYKDGMALNMELHLVRRLAEKRIFPAP